MPWRPRHPGEYPTLGWYALNWITEYLNAPDRPGEDTPLVFTREQAEFVLRFYRLDPATGRRLIRRGVLSRPRGWGKSPIGAAICLLEAIGDVVPAGWDADGRPVGKPWWTVRTPNVHIAATTEDQTRYTWDPLQEMISSHLLDHYPEVEPMESWINVAGRGRIEQLTASASSVKGGKPVFAVADQTEVWFAGNGGLRLKNVLIDNLTKRAGSILETPNAFVPGENSAAEQTAQAYQAQQEGRARLDTGFLWDHREAPADTDMADAESLTHGLRYAYGDSSDHREGCVIHDPPCQPGWAPIDSYLARCWDPDYPEQEARANFLNQITHASDSWMDQVTWRARARDVVVGRRDIITLGFDGSRGRAHGKPDATALIGCRVSDGHLFELGVWEAGDSKAEWAAWEMPVAEVEAAVASAFTTYRVAAFYCDPASDWAGHVAMWESTLPAKMARAANGKIVSATSAKPFSWRMNSPVAVEMAILALESAIRHGEMTHSGSRALTRHVLNARRRLTRGRLGLSKDSTSSVRKIDAAVAAVLAWQARLDVVAAGRPQTRRNVYAPTRIY